MIVRFDVPVTSSSEAATIAEALERLAAQARLGRDKPGYSIEVLPG